MTALRTVPADSILSLDAYTLAQRIHSGELTSVAVTQAFLDRIAEVDGDLHAFLHVGAEDALATARQVDEDIAAGKGPASR